MEPFTCALNIWVRFENKKNPNTIHANPSPLLAYGNIPGEHYQEQIIKNTTDGTP
jgi:hypothetical protein